MKSFCKEKERRPGERHCCLKVIWTVILLLAILFLTEGFSLVWANLQNKTLMSISGKDGQVQKTETATFSLGGQKQAGSGSKSGLKAQPEATRPLTKAQPSTPAGPAASYLKSTPETMIEILKENRFLEEELKLARNSQYYFVLNLKEKTLELRARGLLLKSWKASKLLYSGKPVPLKVTTLTFKSALKPPERKVIKPGEAQGNSGPQQALTRESEPQKKGEKEKKKTDQNQPASSTVDKFEVEALEITDMPGSFELHFDDGLRIYVRSKSGLGERFRQTRELALWYLWYPVRQLLFPKAEQKPRLFLFFEEKRQAQGIYWSFIDGIKGLIWFP